MTVSQRPTVPELRDCQLAWPVRSRGGEESGDLHLQVPEHVAARFIIHLGLELEVILQRDGLGRGRPRRDLVDQPLDVGIFGGGFLVHHERGHPRPAPQRHVDDSVGVAHHIFAIGEVIVEDGIVALRLELIAVMGIVVVLVLRREVLEVHRLTRVGPDAGRHEHQPGQQLRAILRRVRRQELAGLFRQIEQDGVAVEHDNAVVVDRGHLGVRIDGEVIRLELRAGAGVDRDRLVGDAGFLEEQRDLGRVG